MRNLITTAMPVSIGGSSKTDHRHSLLDPTKNLLQTMKSNNVMRIKSAINTPCVDVNVRIPNQQHMTILMRFCYLDISSKSRKDLATLVLTKSCEPNARDIKGRTVLTHACIRHDEALITLLATDGHVDPNITDEEGNSPLMYACRSGNTNVVTTFIKAFPKYGLNVNETNNEGISPLIEAARLGYTDVCRTLVVNGHADVNQRDTNSNTAQDHLVARGTTSTPDLLLLSPTAQRKSLAREHREAMGRRSLSELMDAGSSKVVRHGTAWTMMQSDRVVKRKKLSGKKTVTNPGTDSVPLTQDHIGQLYSVVFQVAIRLPMIDEKPIEEELEDIEKLSARKLFKRPRSSSLSSISDFHQFVANKYSQNHHSIERWLTGSHMLPSGQTYTRNGAILPPLSKSNGHECGPRHQTESIVSVNTQSSSKEIPYSRRSLASKVNTSPPSSPRSHETNSNCSSPSTVSKRSGHRLNTDSPPNMNRLPHRTSSMPVEDDLPKQANIQSSHLSSPPRRLTYPGGTTIHNRQLSEHGKATVNTDSPPNINRLQRRRSSMPHLEDLPSNQNTQSSSRDSSCSRRSLAPAMIISPPSSPRSPSPRSLTNSNCSPQTGVSQRSGFKLSNPDSPPNGNRRRSSIPQLDDLPNKQANSQPPPPPPRRRVTHPSGSKSLNNRQPAEHGKVDSNLESPPNINRLQRRRSSMPHLEDLPSSQFSSSGPARVNTPPGGTVRKTRQQEITSITTTKLVKKSRSAHSWEGKPSTAIPSYLFR